MGSWKILEHCGVSPTTTATVLLHYCHWRHCAPFWGSQLTAPASWGLSLAPFVFGGWWDGISHLFLQSILDFLVVCMCVLGVSFHQSCCLVRDYPHHVAQLDNQCACVGVRNWSASVRSNPNNVTLVSLKPCILIPNTVAPMCQSRLAMSTEKHFEKRLACACVALRLL